MEKIYVIDKPYIDFNYQEMYNIKLEIYEGYGDTTGYYYRYKPTNIHRYSNNNYENIFKYTNSMFRCEETIDEIYTDVCNENHRALSFTTLGLAKASKLILLRNFRIKYNDEIEKREHLKAKFPNIIKPLKEIMNLYPEEFI
jgi:hypothetical protein